MLRTVVKSTTIISMVGVEKARNRLQN